MQTRFAACAFVLFTLLPASAFAQGQGAPPSAPETNPAPKPPPKRIRVGGNVAKANIVSAVPPESPEEAKAAHISGTVLLHAVIDTDGSVLQLEYVSGPPLLMKSAMDAVRQWRYKPVLLNGEHVEVDTTVSVVYSEEGWVGPGPSGSFPLPERAAQALEPTKTSDPQLKPDIQRLFDLWGLKEEIKEQRRTALELSRLNLFPVLPRGPDRAKIVDAYTGMYVSQYSDDYINEFVAVYAKYLTDDDVKALIQFYETPAGQHFSASRARIEADDIQISQKIHADVKARVMTELCKEYPELQAAGNGCAQVAAQKESPSTEPAKPQ
jgi:TonB family protein